MAEVHGREAARDCRRTPQLWVLHLQLRPRLLHTPCSPDSTHAKLRGGVRAACRTATQEAARRKFRRRPLRTAFLCLAAPQAAGLTAGAATLGEFACTAASTDSSSAQQPSGNPRPCTAQPSVDNGAATLGRLTGDGSCAQQPSSLGPHAAQPSLVNGTAGPRRSAGAERLLSADSCAPAQQPSSPYPHAAQALLGNGAALSSRSPGGERPHAADTEAQPSECAPFDLCTPCTAKPSTSVVTFWPGTPPLGLSKCGLCRHVRPTEGSARSHEDVGESMPARGGRAGLHGEGRPARPKIAAPASAAAAAAAAFGGVLYPPAERSQIRDSWRHLMRWSRRWRTCDDSSCVLDSLEKVRVMCKVRGSRLSS